MDVRGVIVCSAGRGIWFIYSATMASGVVVAYGVLWLEMLCYC